MIATEVTTSAGSERKVGGQWYKYNDDKVTEHEQAEILMLCGGGDDRALPTSPSKVQGLRVLEVDQSLGEVEGRYVLRASNKRHDLLI